VLILLFAGCMNLEPTWVGVSEVEHAGGTGDTDVLCAGLRMKDGKTREAAARVIQGLAHPPACLCERLQPEGRWDDQILHGLSGAKTTENISCVGTLLDDPKQPDRPALTTLLLKIPAVRPRLVEAARTEADPEVRAAALPVFRGSKDAAEVGDLVKVLGDTTSDPRVRAATATALFSQNAAADALRGAVEHDADPSVRAAALVSWLPLAGADRDTVLCDRLAHDAAPEVRAQAAATMKATRAPAQLACLREHMLTAENDVSVRAAMLTSLGASPAPEAAAILCDAIPFWVKTYAGTEAPDKSVDILVAQNDRDPDKSYTCVQAGVRASSGLPCPTRAWVGSFFQQLGGHGGVTSCDAHPHSGAASNEISFE
jgi:hypothetical protein